MVAKTYNANGCDKMEKPNVTKSGKKFNLRDEVYQSNPLIQARKDFNIIGMRIFFLGLRGVKPQLSKDNRNADTEFEPLFISTNEIKKILGNDKYASTLKKECEKISRSIIEFNYDNGGFRIMPIFLELKYEPRDGLYLEFSPRMRPYLLDLFESGGYTMFNVEQVFYLSSPYAVRLVELMLQYQNIEPMKKRGVVERLIKMDDLRFMLNVPEGTYKGRLNNFRANVLDVPIREINEKTTYRMSYETVKLPHKEVGFQFTFDMTAVLVKEAVLNASGEPAIDKLRALGFSEQAARAIRDKCADDADCLKRITSATRSLTMKKKRVVVENELGYLRKYIEENWQSPASRAKRNAKRNDQSPPPIEEVLAKDNVRAAKPISKPKARTSSEPQSIGEILRNVIPEIKQPEQPKPNEEPPIVLRPLKSRMPAPDEFNDGEKSLAPSVVDIITPAVIKNEVTPSVVMLLEMCGLTVERFKKLYMK